MEKRLTGQANTDSYSKVNEFMQSNQAELIRKRIRGDSLYQTWFFNGVAVDYNFANYQSPSWGDVVIRLLGNSETISEVEKIILKSSKELGLDLKITE